jgi:hypothetical protein
MAQQRTFAGTTFPGRRHPAHWGASAMRSRQASITFVLTGVAKDSSNIPLAGAQVDCFKVGSNEFVASTIADGSGSYAFTLPTNQAYFTRAYLAGAPDKAGTSSNILVPVQV